MSYFSQNGQHFSCLFGDVEGLGQAGFGVFEGLGGAAVQSGEGFEDLSKLGVALIFLWSEMELCIDLNQHFLYLFIDGRG